MNYEHYAHLADGVWILMKMGHIIFLLSTLAAAFALQAMVNSYRAAKDIQKLKEKLGIKEGE